VTTFDPPLVLVITVPEGLDPTTLTVAALDPATGLLVPLSPTPEPDGTLSVSLSSLAAPPGPPAPIDQPAPAVDPTVSPGQDEGAPDASVPQTGADPADGEAVPAASEGADQPAISA
jgi:hypothetical protein